jgi:hypothetical protein
VRWHTESDNLVLRTELIKLRYTVTAITIKDQQSIRACCTRLYVSVEVLYPVKAEFIVCPAVITNCKHPVVWEALIPAGLVEYTRQDHERWEAPTRRIDTLNCCHPVAIAWLNDSYSTNTVRVGDNL